MRVRYGMSFVSLTSDLYSSELIAVYRVISWYNGQYYNGTQLHVDYTDLVK